jgi:hypothetical protein
VPLREAIGRVEGDVIEVYPPGIPVILEGFRVSSDAVEYLLAARDSGGADRGAGHVAADVAGVVGLGVPYVACGAAFAYGGIEGVRGRTLLFCRLGRG